MLNMTDRHGISKEIFNYLRPQKPQTSRFYILPKIHKNGSSARLIVSSCEAPTEKIFQFVYFILKPLVAKIPSYLKDTTDFLLKLNSIGKVPLGSPVSNVGCSFSLYQYPTFRRGRVLQGIVEPKEHPRTSD